jgi:hypothetical protein
VKLDVKPAVDPFDASLTFGRDGAMRQATLNGSGWTLVMKPAQQKGMDLDFSARNWNLPVGVPLQVSDISLKGTLDGTEIVVPEFEASAMEGKVNGTLRVSWASGVKLDSDLALSKVDARALVGAFTRDIAVTGRVDGNFTVTTEGPTVETLFQSPRGQGKFRVAEGSVSNVDLVAVMQSDAAGQRAGVTKFQELTGEFSGAEHRASYRQVGLQGGVLRGNGSFEIAPQRRARRARQPGDPLAGRAGAGRLQHQRHGGAARDQEGRLGLCAGSSRFSGCSYRTGRGSRSPRRPSCCPRRWCWSSARA